MGVFHVFKLYKQCQIVQNITYTQYNYLTLKVSLNLQEGSSYMEIKCECKNIGVLVVKNRHGLLSNGP